MTAGYESQLVIEGLDRKWQYFELFPFSVAKELAKQNIIYSDKELLCILWDQDWEMNMTISTVEVQKIRRTVDKMDDCQTPECISYLDAYKNATEIFKLEDYHQSYSLMIGRQKKLIQAFDRVNDMDFLLTAWLKYWAYGVNDLEIMQVIRHRRQVRGEEDLNPGRSVFVERYLPARMIYWGQSRFPDLFRSVSGYQYGQYDFLITYFRMILASKTVRIEYIAPAS
ncbi:MAG: hypothetical protein Q9209_006930 [Squamulea sp. 1 TL-2023]